MRIFTRKVSHSAAECGMGTRSGLHGQTLVSMGLVDLDRLLGGGLPLGSLLLVMEDAHSRQHLNLMRYFMAEGVSIRQRVAWLTAGPLQEDPGQFLPAESGVASSSSRAKKNEAETTGAGLRIAWQYEKYVQQQSPAQATSRTSDGSSTSEKATRHGSRALEAGIGREWCRSYDLTKHMGIDVPTSSGMVCLKCSDGGPEGSLATALHKAHGFVSSLSPAASLLPSSHGPEGVGRLVVQSLGSPAWWQHADGAAAAAADDGNGALRQLEQRLVCFVQQLRQVLQDTRCAAMVTCPTGLLTPSTVSRLQHAADVVLSLRTLSDDSEIFAMLPDPESACALVGLSKLPSAGMLAPRLPDCELYVVRNKRRRLAIDSIDVDPDAQSRQQHQQQDSKAVQGPVPGLTDF